MVSRRLGIGLVLFLPPFLFVETTKREANRQNRRNDNNSQRRENVFKYIGYPIWHDIFRPNGANQPALQAVGFRVKAPVTRRPPHRPVREDFPHTVP